MQNFLKYLKFLSTATNQHGVHSPFIYGYVTKCLYDKKKYNSTKSLNVLFKSIAYFKAEQIMLSDNSENLKNAVQEYFPYIKLAYEKTDIVYFSKKEINKAENILLEAKHIHNNTMFLLDGIYKSEENQTLWEGLKQNDKVKVTVDMFYCGAIFFRQEQVKEHFKIRI